MATMVHMKHPDLETTGTATEAAYERIWEPKGWKRVDPEEANLPRTIAAVPDYSAEQTEAEKALSEELVSQEKRAARKSGSTSKSTGQQSASS
jgi:hypothetical protein